MRRAAETVADGIAPLVDLYRPYVDGLANIPRDGRFLLVGNHTQFGSETLLIPYVVRREIGMRVRPLTDRAFGNLPGPAGDLLAACGAVVGAPEVAGELMRHNEPILVFPAVAARFPSSGVNSTGCAGPGERDSRGYRSNTTTRSSRSHSSAATTST